MSEKEELIRLRKIIIEKEFSSLNDMQRAATLTTRGPLQILAGAGSGKTTVLVNRIANLLRWGEAYESDSVYGEFSDEETEIIKRSAETDERLPDELADRLSVSRVYPWRILAITFTNKAANELKSRICAKVGDIGNDIWASTFHSSCARILRRYGDRIGYTNHFTIYDTDDQKRLIKDIMKGLRIDEKMMPVRSVMSAISHAKDEMTDPGLFKTAAGTDARLNTISKIYDNYQHRLQKADAMDFDDIIFNTVVLFKKCPDVLEHYQEQFRYIMVDEYQDTNLLQYELVRLLADKYRNICVVGDDDQSIYKFRGATVRNILEFEKDYEDARTVKLEQNYRSTKTILNAANAVIKNNSLRKAKTLWTGNDQGNSIVWYTASDENDESRFIINTITEGVKNGGSYSDYSVLYRMNSQSQSIERALVRNAVPYKIIGGHRFYERREIRDMMAYLNLISNHHDNNRLKRIINVPKRGIGDRTIGQLEEISNTLGQSMYETITQSDEFEALSRSRDKLMSFYRMIEELTDMLDDMPLSEMYDELLSRTQYESFIMHESNHGDTAVENIQELKSSIIQYEQENGDDASIQGFLEEAALMTDIDTYSEEEDGGKVVLMTLHSAKGLEFPCVFIPGMEENIFPGFAAKNSDEDMQEERRLAYVGITRAKRELYFINSESRMLFGHTTRNIPSRFLRELPQENIEKKHREINTDKSVYIPRQRDLRRHDIAQSKVIGTNAVSGTKINYSVGMRVEHNSFGQGTVLGTRPMASDCLVEVAFDSAGTKKLMASSAKLKILE